MSKQSTHHISHEVSRLIGRLLETAGWNEVKCWWTEDTYCVKGERPIIYEGKEVILLLRVWFVPSKRWDFLTLSNFLVLWRKPDGLPETIPFYTRTFLRPGLFLEYQGIQEVVRTGLDKPIDGAWTVRDGRNLIALFDAYDELALRMGVMQLFRPKPEGTAS